MLNAIKRTNLIHLGSIISLTSHRLSNLPGLQGFGRKKIPKSVLDNLPDVKFMRNAINNIFRKDPATRKVVMTKISTAFVGHFSECPYIMFWLGNGGNGKTFLQEITMLAFGELATLARTLLPTLYVPSNISPQV